ncbi:fumarate reductase subunit FrdC [Actinobacillus porcinus]|uniref:fumarate reductase subunit FrdC n=1 Tax=Actinobacillus porcinus TaxID=51048 RepID=UPI00235370C5|nr:fumarate reductase subunit FrdC [Actinobacillus porcinus]MCI5764924.1 fumarate reductase subunit FrdC [Actinobacillus porcinus]MDD7545313.1 fumarate reductase subunit FrdC [Actinobacillus porcinus]MDY5421896.1 fumarate reductase subunit FrdC [Actinobacillus porcinus]MDY5847723.1 fumarate reductase subunit FrdC [Actinobacillus porcinus]
MSELTSKRKKYVREITPTWWKSWDFYKFYMLREATALPTVWFCLVLLKGVFALGSNTFETGFVEFLQNPVVVILNLISLAALLLHAFTLFNMTGEVMSGTTGIKADVIKKSLQGLFVVVSILGLVLAFI